MRDTFLVSVAIWILSAVLHFRDDSELVDRLKRRDPHAMSVLYDRYGRLTYSVILRIVRNEGVAEDLVQETFLRIWNRIPGFDQQKGALGPWILTVARNRAIDYLRSVEGRAGETTFELDLLERPSLFTSVQSGMLTDDRMKMIRDAVERLTPNQRVVIELAYYEGLSQTEMAERLKQPLGTVKTWVRTALKMLRQEIGEAVA
jgi:RNA polymerase sigma-70 factor (ECF subfamily)